jgi:hypothetical protein
VAPPRGASAWTRARGRRRGRRGCCRRGRAQYAWGQEHHQLAALLEGLGDAKERAQDGDVAEQGHLADVVAHLEAGDAADDEALALPDEHLGDGLARVDGGRGARRPEVHDVAARVVLHHDRHPDLAVLVLDDDGRGHVEPEGRFLELNLGAGRAHGGVGNLLAQLDGGQVVLDGHDLWAGQGARLALLGQGLQGQVDVEIRADDAEGNTRGGQRALGGQGADREIHDIAAQGEAGEGAHRQALRQGEARVRRIEALHGRTAPEEIRKVEALPHEGLGTRVLRHEAAPLDADLLQGAPVENLHARLDLHLGDRDVDRLADELSDLLDVRPIESEEERVGWPVGADGQPLLQYFGGHRRRRWWDGRRPEEGRERGLGDDGGAGRRVFSAGPVLGGDTEKPLQGLRDLLGVGVVEADGGLGERTARGRLPRLVLGQLPPALRFLLLRSGLDLPRVGLGGLGPQLDVGLARGLLGPRPGLAFPLPLLLRDDPDHAVALDLLEPLGREDRVEGLFPGDVAQRDGDLALDVLPDDDVPAALRGENAHDVDDVGVLEVERDQSRCRLREASGQEQCGGDRARDPSIPSSHFIEPRDSVMGLAAAPTAGEMAKVAESEPIPINRASSIPSPTRRM